VQHDQRGFDFHDARSRHRRHRQHSQPISDGFAATCTIATISPMRVSSRVMMAAMSVACAFS
jgi:hypothetical protein